MIFSVKKTHQALARGAPAARPLNAAGFAADRACSARIVSMPNGTCHGCAQGIHEFISEAGQKRLEARVKNMAPWPIGKGEMGAIRHRNIEPDARCNGVIWFYNEDPTPPGGEAYMSWFSNPVVNKAIQTFGGAPPPKPRPVESALFHSLDADGEILESWDVTENVRQLVKDNSCHSITADRPLRDVLSESGGLAEPVFRAEPEPVGAAAAVAEGVPPTCDDAQPAAAAAEPAAGAAEAVVEEQPSSEHGHTNAGMDDDAALQAALAASQAGQPAAPAGAPEAAAVEAQEEQEAAPELESEPDAEPEPEQEPEPEPEPEQEAEPAPKVLREGVGARLTVCVDGTSHDYDGLSPKISIRCAMKC